MPACRLRQSFGLMVNYRCDLERVEDGHAKFREGEAECSRAVSLLLRVPCCKCP